ncbi:MAG TPA: hypothetical protein VH476_05170 [Solirubrobacterales bacterium]
MGRSRFSRANAILLAAAMLAAVALAPAANAAEGLQDPTFGTGGFTLLDEPELEHEYLSDVVVLPDGKILGGGTRGSAGGFLLARFNSNGTPDLSFGPNGIRTEPDTDTAGDTRGINALAMQGDGRIVAAGLGRGPDPDKFDAFGVTRYLDGGAQLDPEFGSGGRSVLLPDGPGEAQGLDLAPGGKIVVSGYRINPSERYEAAVLRLTPGGDPDSTFAAASPVGFAHFALPGSEYTQAHAVSSLSNGSVITGGESEAGAWLAKLNSEGELVNGFGTAGLSIHDLGQEEEPSGEFNDIAIQPDGRIVATGSSFPATDTKTQLIVARFTSNGELDPSFGTGGVFTLDATAGYDAGEALSILPDGKILVAGLGGTADTWLLRLTPDGQLDSSFGSGGQTILSGIPGEDYAAGLALQPDGRPVTVGEGETASKGAELLAARFTGPETEKVKVSLVPTTASCAGRNATIVGTQHADKLKGTKRADVIAGLGGNDRISSLAGNDVVCGGAGKDTIKGGSGRDRLIGEGGKDKLLGEGGKDKLIGGTGRDVCNGGAGRDARAAGCETRQKLP